MAYPSVPRIHGNGFVQMDLDPLHRLHIWDHRIPRQSTDSSIHDHSFGFVSQCLEGTIVNVVLEPQFNSNIQIKLGRGWTDPTHNLYQVVRDPASSETSLRSMRKRCSFKPVRTDVVCAGKGYAMQAGWFHASLHLGTTVTVMRKDQPIGAYLNKLARVACRIGERPDDSWVREEGQEIPDFALDLVEKYRRIL